MTETQTYIDPELEELRQIILRSQEDEKGTTLTTKLLEIESSRKKIKKINPKFCCPWNQLEFGEQTNRIVEFVNRFASDEDLVEATAKKIRILLVRALKNNTLEVEYDEVRGKIIQIPKLYYSKEDGYYLGLYVNSSGEFVSRRTKISACKMEDNSMSIITESYKQPEPVEKISFSSQITLKPATDESPSAKKLTLNLVRK